MIILSRRRSRSRPRCLKSVVSAGDGRYRRLFEHFCQLEIGEDKRKKQRSLQERFKKKKTEKMKRAVYFQNISANFKSY